MGILEIRSGQMLWGSVHADPDCASSTRALGDKSGCTETAAVIPAVIKQ